MASNALNDKSNPPFGSSGKIAGGVAGRIINDITNTPNQPVQTKTLQSQPNNIKQDNSNNNNSVHTRTIPQSAAEVQPDPKTGTFTPIDPQQFKGADKKPLALSGAQITQAQGELEAMAKDKIKMSDPAYASAVGKAQALFDAKKTASDDLNAWSQGMKSTATKFNNVLSQLQNKDVSVGLQNAFGSGGFSLNDLKKLNDPKYSSLITGLNTLQQEGLMPGDSLSGSATLDVWKQDLQLAYAQQEAPYDAHLMTYVGGNSQPQGTLPPVSGSVGNQFINQGTPPSSGNLPTISGTPQTGSLKNSSSLLPFSTVYYEFR